MNVQKFHTVGLRVGWIRGSELVTVSCNFILDLFICFGTWK